MLFSSVSSCLSNVLGGTGCFRLFLVDLVFSNLFLVVLVRYR